MGVPFLGQSKPLTPQIALWQALFLWWTLLILSLVVMATALLVGWPRTATIHADTPAMTGWWMRITVITYASVVPIVAFANRAIFKRFWKDGVVQPYGYLIGSGVLWGGFTVCVVVAAAATMVGASFWISSVLGILGIVLLLATWPAGRNMVNPRPRDEEDDDDIFHITPEQEDDREETS